MFMEIQAMIIFRMEMIVAVGLCIEVSAEEPVDQNSNDLSFRISIMRTHMLYICAWVCMYIMYVTEEISVDKNVL